MSTVGVSLGSSERKVLPVSPNNFTFDRASPAQRVAEPCRKPLLVNPFFLISSVTETSSFGGRHREFVSALLDGSRLSFFQVTDHSPRGTVQICKSRRRADPLLVRPPSSATYCLFTSLCR